MKRIVLFAILLLSAAYVLGGGARVVNESKIAEFYITDSGDTAAVIQFQPSAGIDSFLYHDSIQYTADTSLWDTCSFLSPSTYYLLTPTLDTQGTYVCSVKYAADTVGFTWVCPEDATIDTVVARLYDSLTGIAGIDDSMTVDTNAGHTALTLTAKYSQVTFADHRPMVLATATGGSAAISKDSTITTLAMVLDSMVAAINALDSAKYWTAANVGDTVYTITSDDKGLMLWATNTDTATDTSTLFDNATSKSTRTDTLPLTISLVENDFRGTGVYGDIILQSIEADTAYGIGISDSAWIWLLTGHPVDTGIVYTVLAKDSAAALPCTLHVALPHAAANDTIFHNFMKVAWAVSDTMTDTNMYIEYPISIDLIVTDGF